MRLCSSSRTILGWWSAHSAASSWNKTMTIKRSPRVPLWAVAPFRHRQPRCRAALSDRVSLETFAAFQIGDQQLYSGYRRRPSDLFIDRQAAFVLLVGPVTRKWCSLALSKVQSIKILLET